MRLLHPFLYTISLHRPCPFPNTFSFPLIRFDPLYSVLGARPSFLQLGVREL